MVIQIILTSPLPTSPHPVPEPLLVHMETFCELVQAGDSGELMLSNLSSSSENQESQWHRFQSESSPKAGEDRRPSSKAGREEIFPYPTFCSIQVSSGLDEGHLCWQGPSA